LTQTIDANKFDAKDAMASPVIPVLDVSAIFGSDEEKIKDLARVWDETLRRVGFAVIVGHNVPNEIGERVYEAAKRFFAEPLEEKMKASVANHYGAGGYVAQGAIRLCLLCCQYRACRLSPLWGYRFACCSSQPLLEMSSWKRVDLM
jgi:hypothetical protein